MKKHQKQQKLINNPEFHLSFSEHLAELRSRLFIIALCVSLATLAGYFVQQQLIGIMLRPAKGQSFIYTSPTSGINFLFQVCLYFGIYVSLPVIIFNALKFLQPLFNAKVDKLIWRYSLYSFLLATVGVIFGYFAGLPFALHFLGAQFTSSQIQALYTINEYGAFVSFYLLGSALLFQLFLILILINRIKPLQPKKLFKYEKYVIGGAFIVSFLMVPAPNIMNQIVLAVPIIVMYQLAILIIAITNRRKNNKTLFAETIVEPETKREPMKPVLISDIIRA